MKQIALIVTLSVAGFAAAFVALIASRLTTEEVALLAGVVCGVGVAVPLGVLGGVAMAGRRRDRSAAALPVIYVTQPPKPTVLGSQSGTANLPAPRPVARPLNIIGQSAFDVDENNGVS